MKTSKNRFEVRDTKGIKFFHPAGYTMGTGFGVFDSFVNSFLSDEGENHAWSWKNKGVADDVTNQLNAFGPSDKLFYAKTK